LSAKPLGKTVSKRKSELDYSWVQDPSLESYSASGIGSVAMGLSNDFTVTTTGGTANYLNAAVLTNSIK
jgi:hypothetical protein